MTPVEWVNKVRAYELERVIPLLPPSGAILEIGGGTGWQARRLSQLGYDVTSVELSGSEYLANAVFPIRIYDGVNVPANDEEFDIVFSSHTLEHVESPHKLHRELSRVLKPGGVGIHVMPSSTWSLWTLLAHPAFLAKVARTNYRTTGAVLRHAESTADRIPDGSQASLLKRWRQILIPPRHGVRGSLLGELFTFTRPAWSRYFTNHGYQILATYPLGLFYTGSALFRESFPIQQRTRVARLLGSSSIAYAVRSGPSERA
jgi:SAM-dependent methyltransferase